MNYRASYLWSMSSHFNIVYGCHGVWAVLSSHSPLPVYPVYVPSVAFSLEWGDEGRSCAAFTDLWPGWLNIWQEGKDVSCRRVIAQRGQRLCLRLSISQSNFCHIVMCNYFSVRGHFTLLLPLSHVLVVWVFLFSNAVSFWLDVK